MRSWELAVRLDPAADLPVFLQIARAVSADVRRGRLRAGDALPSSRALSRSLAVHRNTVLAAYRELAAEGWIETEPARCTVVSSDVANASANATRARTSRAAPATPSATVGFDLGAAIDPYPVPAYAAGTLVMAGGVPDLRLVPRAELARAYRKALADAKPRGRSTLDYGDAQGHPRLREALGAMLAALRGIAAPKESVLVTRGSQMALDLVARALLAPGDVVAIESLGYRPAWAAFQAAGARLAPLPIDEHGLDVDALRELCERERVRAVYVTPHHQYPTTAVLSAGRRLALMELARARRIAVIEDDYDHEFHYEGRPVLPLASADPAGVVVYLGTLSKILAPGLRLGFVVAPTPLLEKLTAIRTFIDRQGDHTLERAVAELLEDGEVQRHARRARRAYLARRDALTEALREHLGDALTFEPPVGGMAIWARAAPGIDVDAWAARALDRKVAFSTAKRFAFDGRKRGFLRLGFAALDEKELREAARRMAACLDA
jgi:GntR family transcriptional regulator/MocR family aminotransferase